MLRNVLFGWGSNKDLANKMLFAFCQNAEWDTLLNYAKTHPGNCYRLLEETDGSGNTVFHIIAKVHPHPYQLVGQLLCNINYTIPKLHDKVHELLNRENLQHETFHTLCKEKKQDLYKELMPNLQTQIRFFR